MLIPTNIKAKDLIAKTALVIARNESDNYYDVKPSYDVYQEAIRGNGHMRKCISCAMEIYNLYQDPGDE